MLKSHNYAVCTMSIKNMALGAPARTGKGYYHAGFHLIHYNMLVTAQAMQPFWGAAVIDAHEGMEGNGPSQGTQVASRLAIASDRVGAECMGVDTKWAGEPTGALPPPRPSSSNLLPRLIGFAEVVARIGDGKGAIPLGGDFDPLAIRAASMLAM